MEKPLLYFYFYLYCTTCCKLTCPVIPENLDPHGVFKVELHKTTAGLGFSLDGGKSSSNGDKPLTVKRIFKGDDFCFG